VLELVHGDATPLIYGIFRANYGDGARKAFATTVDPMR